MDSNPSAADRQTDGLLRFRPQTSRRLSLQSSREMRKATSNENVESTPHLLVSFPVLVHTAFAKMKIDQGM